MTDIGKKLKELRERNSLTRKEAVTKLHDLNIDISDKTLYGYESGRNAANADMFLALCKIYNCTNIAKEFSDVAEDVLFTNAEWKIIEKYRALDQHGKETVDIILDRETARVTALSKQYARIKEYADLILEYRESSLNSAHERTDAAPTPEGQVHDDAIMDDDSEWE